jgi:group I intron endonuclease
MWTHIESGKIYIGSAIDLSKRFSQYYSKSYLKRNKSYINNALSLHGFSSFSLTILEYVEITNLSKDKAKKLILEREQHYFHTILPEYNIQKIAGSSLGQTRSEETKALMSLAQRSINRTGEDNPMFGQTHTPEARAIMSLVQMRVDRTGEKNPMFGRTGENHPMFGQIHSKKKVYLYSYDNPSVLYKEFNSYTEAGAFFDCHRKTIYRHIDSEKLYLDKWILCSKVKS